MSDFIHEITAYAGTLKTMWVGGVASLLTALITQGKTFAQIVLSMAVGMFMASIFTPAVVHFIPSIMDLESPIAAGLGIMGYQLIITINRKIKDGSIFDFLPFKKK